VFRGYPSQARYFEGRRACLRSRNLLKFMMHNGSMEFFRSKNVHVIPLCNTRVKNGADSTVIRPPNAVDSNLYRPLLTLFPFLPSTIPSNFFPKASRTLLRPAHSALIFFIRQLAMIAKPTALSDGRLRSCLPTLPRKVSAKRRRGEDFSPGVMPISERRFRSIELLGSVY